MNDIFQSYIGDYAIQHRNVLRLNASVGVLHESRDFVTIAVLHIVYKRVLLFAAGNFAVPLRVNCENIDGSSEPDGSIVQALLGTVAQRHKAQEASGFNVRDSCTRILCMSFAI